MFQALDQQSGVGSFEKMMHLRASVLSMLISLRGLPDRRPHTDRHTIGIIQLPSCVW